MKLLVSGWVDVPADKRDAALEGAAPLVREALAETGCVHYAWTLDPLTPGRIRIFEEWIQAADFAAHLAGPAYQGMLAHLGGIGILAAVTEKHRVDLSEPVYDTTGIPRADFFTQPASN
jgi:quinol monooxygenase YgiN